MKKRVPKKKILVIVAHPDDETIWMGGTLLKNKDKWDTSIISLCRKHDKDRAPRFKKACKALHAKGIMSDLEDEKLEDTKPEDIIRRIEKLIKNRNYDYIFTHGKNGEYGHKRHIEVHQAVIVMLKKRILSCKKIFFFSYYKQAEFCFPNRKADKFIYLSNVIFKRKQRLIKDVYDFKKGSFEYECSKKNESFRVKSEI